MKRVSAILLLLSLLFALFGCGAPVDLTGENSEKSILEISADPEPYLGKTVRLSGYYTAEIFYGETYHYVLKNPDSSENVGFEIRYEGDYPDRGTAVVIEGTLTSETVYGQAYLYIDVSDLTVLQPME